MNRAFACALLATLLGAGCVLTEDFDRYTISGGDASTGDGGDADGSAGDGSAGDAAMMDAEADAGPEPCDRADTVYVAIGGDDEGPGTLEAPLATIQAAMQKVSDDEALARVYVGAGVFETTYESDDELHLADGVTLRGGHSPDFCDYDPAVYVTRIEQKYLGGQSIDPQNPPIVTLMGDDLPNGVVLEGLRIILGRETDDPHVGLRLRNTSAELRDLWVLDGDGRSLQGILVEGAASLLMERVTVLLDNATHETLGVSLVDVVSADIRQLFVDRPFSTNSLPSIGFSALYQTTGATYSLYIDRSRIHGGRGGSNSTAISIEATEASYLSPTVWITNSLIHGGENDGQGYGVRLLGRSGNVSVFNNTIYTGEGSGFGYGLSYRYFFAGPDIRNNIFFAGQANHFCVTRTSNPSAGWSGSDETLSNNLFFDCDFALLHDGVNGDGGRLRSAATLNALSNVNANQVAAISPLGSLTGPDLLTGTLNDNDWGFSSDALCAYTNAAFASSRVTHDLFGRPRRATPSIGAVEFDGTCTTP